MTKTFNEILSREAHKFQTGWVWYALAMICFVVIPYGNEYYVAQKIEIEKAAILEAPDEEYLNFVQYVPTDICVESDLQDILLERHPGNTDQGWNAILVDEIGRKAADNVWGKYNGDYHYKPFYEVIPESSENPANTLVLSVPLQQRFIEGTYRWESQITLLIPMSNGEIVMKEMDRIFSEEFTVTSDCRKSETATIEVLEDIISDIKQ